MIESEIGTRREPDYWAVTQPLPLNGSYLPNKVDTTY